MYAERSPATDVTPNDFPEGWGATRGAESRQEGFRPVDRLFYLEPLRVKLIREDDGRITMASPDLDIAAFGATELEAWESFLCALRDLRHFYFENKPTLSPWLRKKLHIFESTYILQME